MVKVKGKGRWGRYALYWTPFWFFPDAIPLAWLAGAGKSSSYIIIS